MRGGEQGWPGGGELGRDGFQRPNSKTGLWAGQKEDEI